MYVVCPQPSKALQHPAASGVGRHSQAPGRHQTHIRVEPGGSARAARGDVQIGLLGSRKVRFVRAHHAHGLVDGLGVGADSGQVLDGLPLQGQRSRMEANATSI